ncbi:MAG: hypothetical protein KGJ07_04225 [Patescibacteria group bacterium]|nr:hypothetical protein [Patescibacteria group bacterium]MDE2590120.1 hypothetical protein [Patescibacteria group bacterium]
MQVARYENNPIIMPNPYNLWEGDSAFNCSVVKEDGLYKFVYRAISTNQEWRGKTIKLSTIGYCESVDGYHVGNRKLFIKPEYPWEEFGCEDPRITKIDNKYVIFYTAISAYPPGPDSIRVAVAVSDDLKTVKEKHLVTPFNAKAMALFPQKINGKYYAILTPNTDRPPARVSIAEFDSFDQIWDQDYWQHWYGNLGKHVLPLLQSTGDQIEVGSAPILTSKGWLVLYCTIENYFATYQRPKVFRIDGVLLDSENPMIIRGKTREPLLIPQTYYELYGNIPNIIFPSGALLEQDKLLIYYGATDTTSCVASVNVNELLAEMETNPAKLVAPNFMPAKRLMPFEGNPILFAKENRDWEAKTVFNPAAIDLGGKIHLLYRAMGQEDTSVMGYASSTDGFHIDDRLPDPAYVPREDFEKKNKPGVGSGCEDPRLTLIDDKVYMLYTAYNGLIPRVALTFISPADFMAKKWNWSTPILITSEKTGDKDAAILPEKINGKYAIFHRVEPDIWIDFVDNLDFTDRRYLDGQVLFSPRKDMWDSGKIGIGSTPIKTPIGWVLIYHAITKEDNKYRIGLALLDLLDPTKVLVRLDYPILEPTRDYSYHGIRPGAVFTNGAVLKDDVLYVYYGASDQVICVARVYFSSVLETLREALHK